MKSLFLVASRCTAVPKLILVAVTVITTTCLVSCDDGLKVKFHVCQSGYQNCVLIAKFKDRESCEEHRQVSEMLCRRSPMEVNCKAHSSAISSSKCTD